MATVTISYSDFTKNEALGGSGTASAAGQGLGGAIRLQSVAGGTVLTMSHSTVVGNVSRGGDGGVAGGRALGGGILAANDNGVFSVLNVSHSTIAGNLAIGGAGGVGGKAVRRSVAASVRVGTYSGLAYPGLQLRSATPPFSTTRRSVASAVRAATAALRTAAAYRS